MEFYVINNLESTILKSQSIDISLFSKIMKTIEKSDKKDSFKTMNDIEPYDVVYMEKAKILSANTEFNSEVKKDSFALITPGKIFKLLNSKNEIYYYVPSFPIEPVINYNDSFQ